MNGRNILICLAALVLAAPTFAGDRTFEESFAADSVERLRINNGVGDVRITAGDTDVIDVEITLTPRRGGMFSSMKKAEHEVKAAVLTTTRGDGTLLLELDSDSPEPRFEARWTVTAPARIGLDLELGVGDVRVAGLAGGIEMEVGVGNVSIEVAGGDVAVSVGVGNGTVRGPGAAYGSVSASGGVGGASIEAAGETFNDKGFVGHTSSWKGDGPYGIELEVGVGDAEIILD